MVARILYNDFEKSGINLPSFVRRRWVTLQYSVLADITRDTGISTADLVQGTGFCFLFLGWSCLFWQPIALTYGRRWGGE